MKFSKLELKRLTKKQNLTVEEEIEANILIFINGIHLNKQDFYSSHYDSHYYGDVELWFSKEPNCLFGHCFATVKTEDKVIEFIFNEQGFERLDDVLGYED